MVQEAGAGLGAAPLGGVGLGWCTAGLRGSGVQLGCVGLGDAQSVRVRLRHTGAVTARRSRAENRAEMEARILHLGRDHLARHGAAALSLRAIARDLGVASSAVYRYVDSRDALLTLLLVDAYTNLADAVDDALLKEAGAGDTGGRVSTGNAGGRVGADGAGGRVGTIALAMRDWAITHPAQWGLIYGAPVPGYAAPAERTTGPGTRVMRRLLEVIAAPPATKGAASSTESAAARPAEYDAFLTSSAEELDVEATPAQAAAAVRAWCGIVGTISMELHGQLGPEPGASPELGRAILLDAVAALAPTP